MTPKAIGAGLGRTGTASLKMALEHLLGEPCYHMMEVFRHPEHVSSWHAAANGETSRCIDIVGEYGAAVDWPASAFWPELSAAYPEAIILLSVRDPESWWESAHETIFGKPVERHVDENPEWANMIQAVFGARFTTEISCKESCLAAFEKHYDHVHQTAPSNRLVVWQASDGWAPLCSALGKPVPDMPFPKVNTKQDFLQHMVDANH